jgi:hypothetical protein
MKEETKTNLQSVKIKKKEESHVVISQKKNQEHAELGEMGVLFEAYKEKKKEPSSGQWEKSRMQLMEEIRQSNENTLTTLKDKLSTTDSLLVKSLIYAAIIIAALIFAAAAFFVFQEFTTPSVQAASVVTAIISTFPV